MSNIGIKGSRDGFNVYDTDITHYTFHSSHLSLKYRYGFTGVATTTNFTKTHGYGYAPIFDGYVKNGGKYFKNYSITPTYGNGFENNIYGSIYTDSTKIYVNCATTNALVYLLYADPASSPTAVTDPAATGIFGLKFSQSGTSVTSANDYQDILSSRYQTPFIVNDPTASNQLMSVTLPSETVAAGATFQTNVSVDLANPLGYPAHFDVSRDLNALAAADPLVGASADVPPFSVAEEELSISASVIRYRISRTYVGPLVFVGGSCTFPAQTFTIRPYLTQIALP